jgi:hypothetical protein
LNLLKRIKNRCRLRFSFLPNPLFFKIFTKLFPRAEILDFSDFLTTQKIGGFVF